MFTKPPTATSQPATNCRLLATAAQTPSRNRQCVTTNNERLPAPRRSIHPAVDAQNPGEEFWASTQNTDGFLLSPHGPPGALMTHYVCLASLFPPHCIPHPPSSPFPP